MTQDQQVARAVAVAMADAQVRTDILMAMSESPYVEHKLRLQEFVTTPRAQRLATLGGRRLGTDARGFARAVDALPTLDFYVPRRNDRTTWSGSINVIVAAAMADDAAPSHAFTVRGDTIAFERAAAGAVTFLLAPAESRSLRFDRRSTGGKTIQHIAEKPGGGVVRRFDRHGRLVEEVQLAELRERPVGANLALLTGSGPIDTTFLDGFETNATDGAIGTLEIEFRAEYYDAAGTLREANEVEIHDIATDFEYSDWDVPLLFRRVTDNSTQYVRLQIVETDWTTDDDMGTEDYSWSDNGVARTHSGSGDDSNVKLEWTPKGVLATGNFADIVGPGYIKPSRQCTWSLDTNVDSPTIEWRVGWNVIGNGPEVTYTASGNVELEVQVWNMSTGEGANAAKSINVSTSNGDCNAQ